MATISAAITESDEAINLSATLGTVVADDPTTHFGIIIDDEQLWVHETSSDGLFARVKRGVGGSTAAVHAAAATATVAKRATVVMTKAGAISDADFDADSLPPIGTVCLDISNFKFYVRTGAATWKAGAAMT